MSQRAAYPAGRFRGFVCEGCNEPKARLRMTWWRGERDDKKQRDFLTGLRIQGACVEVQQTKLVLFCRKCRRLHQSGRLAA